MKLFFLKGRKHHDHALTFKFRHTFGPSELLELDCEAEKEFLALVGEHNAPSAEENGGLHFRSLLQEFLRVLELELEVVLVGVGTETYLLDDYLRRIGLHFLGLFLLLIEIFLVIKDLAYRRIGLIADHDQVELHFACLPEGGVCLVDTGIVDVIADETDLCGRYLLIDIKLILSLLGGTHAGTGETSWSGA